MLYELLYKSLSEMEGFFYLLMYIKAKGRLLKVYFTSCYALHFQIFKLPQFQIASFSNCISILFQSKHSFVQLFKHSFFEFCRN